MHEQERQLYQYSVKGTATDTVLYCVLHRISLSVDSEWVKSEWVYRV